MIYVGIFGIIAFVFMICGTFITWSDGFNYWQSMNRKERIGNLANIFVVLFLGIVYLTFGIIG